MPRHLRSVVWVMPPVAVLSAARGECAGTFDGDLLTPAVRDSLGRIMAVNTWRRQAR
jgi:hypothetical protein